MSCSAQTPVGDGRAMNPSVSDNLSPAAFGHQEVDLARVQEPHDVGSGCGTGIGQQSVIQIGAAIAGDVAREFGVSIFELPLMQEWVKVAWEARSCD